MKTRRILASLIIAGSLGIGLATVSTITETVVSPTPAAAHHINDGEWTLSHYPSSVGDLWYRAVQIYDNTTGRTWQGWEYWTAAWGGRSVFGPIMERYAWEGWEWGLGAPQNEVYYSHWGATGPVFQQNYEWGVIRYHSNNLCRCYAEGGYHQVIYY